MNDYFEKQLDNMIGIDDKNINIDISQYPEKLYKYRCCNKNGFATLQDEYLWANNPKGFDDSSDSIVHLKLASEMPSLQKFIYNHLGEIIYYNIPPKGMKKRKASGQTLEKYKAAQNEFYDSSGKYNAKKANKILLLEMKKMSPKLQQLLRKELKNMETPEYEEKIKVAITGVFDKIVETLRNNMFVCCLTKRKDNKKMWEDYSKNYEGFVIEYDLHKCMNTDELQKILLHLFPVQYYKRLPTVALLPFLEEELERVFYKKETNIDDAQRKLYKQLFIKHNDYNIEEEWRIISDKNVIKFPVISAVYMGHKIKKRNEQRITKICKKKNIELYKQVANPITHKLEFKKIF